MSEEQEVKLVTVDLFGGVQVQVPEEQAKTLIAGRDEQKKRLVEMQQAIESKAQAEQQAIEAAKKAEEMRIAEEAAKRGELDQLKALHQSELEKANKAMLGLKIQSAIASRDNVAKTAIADIAAAVMSDPDVKPDTDLNSYLDGFLSQRPHFTVSKASPGSGGDAGKPASPEVPTITYDEYSQNRQKYSAEIAEGKLNIKG